MESLHSQPEGLACLEAARRLVEFGPNRIERLERRSLTYRFVRSVSHFLACILWTAAGLAFVAEWSEPGAGMGTLGMAIIGVILINGVFSFWQEYRAERELMALQQLIIAIAYLPIGNVLFGTAPISLSVWLFVVPFALAMLLLEEFRKWLIRRVWRTDQPADESTEA